MTDTTIPVELSPKLKKEQIVTSYVVDFKTHNLILDLNHKYAKKKIISPLEPKWPKTIKTLVEQLECKGIKQNHITMLTDTTQANWKIFSESEDAVGDLSKKKGEHEFPVYKYSNRMKGDLHEAVILGGKPVFLKYSNGLITSVEQIKEEARIIKPPHIQH